MRTYRLWGTPDQYPVDTGRLRRVVEVVAERSGWAHRVGEGACVWGLRRAHFLELCGRGRRGRRSGAGAHPACGPGGRCRPHRAPGARAAQCEGAAVSAMGVALMRVVPLRCGARAGSTTAARARRRDDMSSPGKTFRHRLPGQPGPPPPTAPGSGGAWRAAADPEGSVPGPCERWHGPHAEDRRHADPGTSQGTRPQAQ